jgi:hypothetical protein
LGSPLFIREAEVLVIDPRTGSGVSVSDLRFSFKIEKTSEPVPNKADIEIYNMNSKTRGNFETVVQRLVKEQSGETKTKEELIVGAIVIVNAGYVGTMDQLFQGNVRKFTTKKNGPDIITKIEAADGANGFEKGRLDKSYVGGTKVFQIVQDITKAMGLSLAPTAEAVLDKMNNSSFLNGYAASGDARELMISLMKKLKLEWSIQDNLIQIIPQGGITSQTAVVLSPETGLVDSPSNTERGIFAKSLLQPKLAPGKPVRISSESVNGDFRIYKVKHEGDTRGSNWYSEIEAK